MSIWKKIKRLFSRKSKRDETNPFWNYERGSPRQSILLFVRTPENPRFVERTGDLGFSGFSFLYKKKLKPGTQITLRFQPPNASVSIQAQGIVLEQDGVTVRGQFEEIDLEDQRMLARWLYESSVDDEKKP